MTIAKSLILDDSTASPSPSFAKILNEKKIDSNSNSQFSLNNHSVRDLYADEKCYSSNTQDACISSINFCPNETYKLASTLMENDDEKIAEIPTFEEKSDRSSFDDICTPITSTLSPLTTTATEPSKDVYSDYSLEYLQENILDPSLYHAKQFSESGVPSAWVKKPTIISEENKKRIVNFMGFGGGLNPKSYTQTTSPKRELRGQNGDIHNVHSKFYENSKSYVNSNFSSNHSGNRIPKKKNSLMDGLSKKFNDSLTIDLKKENGVCDKKRSDHHIKMDDKQIIKDARNVPVDDCSSIDKKPQGQLDKVSFVNTSKDSNHSLQTPQIVQTPAKRIMDNFENSSYFIPYSQIPLPTTSNEFPLNSCALTSSVFQPLPYSIAPSSAMLSSHSKFFNSSKFNTYPPPPSFYYPPISSNFFIPSTADFVSAALYPSQMISSPIDDLSTSSRGTFVGDIKSSVNVIQSSDFDKQLEALVDSLRPIKDEEFRHKEFYEQLQVVIKNRFPHARLERFGSTVNGFSLKNADLDFCLFIDLCSFGQSPPVSTVTNTNTGSTSEITMNASTLEEKQEIQSKFLTELGEYLKKELTWCTMKILSRARVPIIKLKDLKSGLSCDIGVNNYLAIHNTRLLKLYGEINTRLVDLAIILKYWSKKRYCNEPYMGTLSSYCLLVMIIFYLQRMDPPALPVLQNRFLSRSSTEQVASPKDSTHSFGEDHLQTILDIDNLFFSAVIEGFNVFYCNDSKVLSIIRSNYNDKHTCLLSLLTGFFKYYAYEFPYANYVISIRTGQLLTKESKSWTIDNNSIKASYWFCVEDPFEISYNLARVVSRESLYYIRGQFIRATKLLSRSVSLEQLFSEQWMIVDY